MPLSDTEIIRALTKEIWGATCNGKPVGADELTINPSSVNVSLHREILEVHSAKSQPIDLHDPDSFRVFKYDCANGFTIEPGRLYLAAVRESFDCGAPLWIGQNERVALDESRLLWDEVYSEKETWFYPKIDGRSTTGRVGLGNHITAGHGDWFFGSGDSFGACFTLELTGVLPVIVREGDEIGQVLFEPLQGAPSQRYSGAYQEQFGPRVPSLGAHRFQRQQEGRGA